MGRVYCRAQQTCLCKKKRNMTINWWETNWDEAASMQCRLTGRACRRVASIHCPTVWVASVARCRVDCLQVVEYCQRTQRCSVAAEMRSRQRNYELVQCHWSLAEPGSQQVLDNCLPPTLVEPIDMQAHRIINSVIGGSGAVAHYPTGLVGTDWNRRRNFGTQRNVTKRVKMKELKFGN